MANTNKLVLNLLGLLLELLLVGEILPLAASADAEMLTNEISKLADTLDERVRTLYMRISASRPLFMAAMQNGKCSGCGMQVPVASARMVRMAAHLVTCTTCGHILYDNAGAVASSRKVEDVDDENVSKVRGIARFSSKELMHGAFL